MIFNRKITLYCNEWLVTGEELADLAALNSEQFDSNWEWTIHIEEGKFEAKCNCGCGQ